MSISWRVLTKCWARMQKVKIRPKTKIDHKLQLRKVKRMSCYNLKKMIIFQIKLSSNLRISNTSILLQWDLQQRCKESRRELGVRLLEEMGPGLVHQDLAIGRCTESNNRRLDESLKETYIKQASSTYMLLQVTWLKPENQDQVLETQMNWLTELARQLQLTNRISSKEQNLFKVIIWAILMRE